MSLPWARACRVGLALALMPAAAAAAARPGPPPPPLNISADNVTGSHGPEGDVVLLNRNVRITRGTTVLTADSGRYVRARGMLYLDGSVKMVDSTTTVTCDHASYSENDDVLEVSGNVHLLDKDTMLEAPEGSYDRLTGRGDLTGGVHGRRGRQRLVADEASWFRDRSLIQARGNVRGSDEENRLELNARSIDFDRATEEALATGEPVLRSRDGDGRITELRADTLRVNTASRVAEAIDSVRVSRDTLQARADYALFDDVAQHGWMLGSPRVWDDQTTVSGDTIEVHTAKRVLQSVVVRGHAVMDYAGTHVNTVGEASRLTGDRVRVYFTHEDIDSLVATGGARNEYTAPARTGKTAEANLAQGDTITVFFRARKIDRARVEGDARGEYHLAVDVGDTTAARREVVRYDARRILYDVPRSTIVLDHEAHLDFHELTLKARRVEYDVDAQTLVARGNPDLVDRGDQVSGNLMTYDLESRVGTIYQAETTYEQGLYHGERIRKAGENELDVLNGSYTTCDLVPPHYHFAAHYMKIYLKDKLVAKPVVFYVKHVPLFALPFWVFPIKPGRHSGFLFPQFEFGFNNRSGQFIRNAGYYWAANDYMDFTAAADYYQADPSYVLRGEGVYKLLYVLDGDFRGTYAKNEATRKENWDFNAEHQQNLTPRTHLTANGSFVSSRDYNSSDQFGRPLSQRLDQFLNSSIAVTHNADWASISMFVDRRQNLNADDAITDPDGTGPLPPPAPPGVSASLANLTESLPSLAIAFPTRTLGSLGLLRGTPLSKALSTLYFSLSSRFLSQREQRGFVSGYRSFLRDSVPDSTTVIAQRITTRRALANSASLSDSRRLLGWINITPRLSGNAVVWDFDEQGHRVVPSGTWSSSVGASATFYGTFMPRLGSLLGIRHVIFPTLNYVYSPAVTGLTYVDSLGIRHDRFRSFGGIGISGFKSSRLDFGLNQRLQVKIKRGDQVERLDNLLTWNIGGSYNFLYREQGQLHPLSTLSSSVFLQPPGVANASLSWTTDVYQARPVRSLGYNVGLNLVSGGHGSPAPALPVEATAPASPAAEGQPEFREAWSLGLAYSYSGGYALANRWNSVQTANAVLHYQITPGWTLDYSASYDVTNRNLQTQRFALNRDLHCWTASFTRTFITGGEAEYYFRIGIKQQREIYLERGTRVGSIGGIQ